MCQYKIAAAQLREDAVDCWGIRRKMNLKSAAILLEKASLALENKKEISSIMNSKAIKASKLIEYLNRLIKDHGDQEVYFCADDNNNTKGIEFVKKESTDNHPYIPKGSFKLL